MEDTGSWVASTRAGAEHVPEGHIQRTKNSGLLIVALGPHFARLVTHRDFDDVQCDQAIEILRKALVA